MIYDYVTDNSYEPGAHKISYTCTIRNQFLPLLFCSEPFHSYGPGTQPSGQTADAYCWWTAGPAGRQTACSCGATLLMMSCWSICNADKTTNRCFWLRINRWYKWPINSSVLFCDCRVVPYYILIIHMGLINCCPYVGRWQIKIIISRWSWFMFYGSADVHLCTAEHFTTPCASKPDVTSSVYCSLAVCDLPYRSHI